MRSAMLLARYAILVPFLLSVSGCPQRGYIWIAEGSTAERLILRIGSRRGHTGGVAVMVLRIDRCAESADYRTEAVWMVWNPQGTANLKELVYGSAPPGWEQAKPAPPLTPGCYHATITASPGRVEFTIAPDGTVKETPSRSSPMQLPNKRLKLAARVH